MCQKSTKSARIKKKRPIKNLAFRKNTLGNVVKKFHRASLIRKRFKFVGTKMYEEEAEEEVAADTISEPILAISKVS